MYLLKEIGLIYRIVLSNYYYITIKVIFLFETWSHCSSQMVTDASVYPKLALNFQSLCFSLPDAKTPCVCAHGNSLWAFEKVFVIWLLDASCYSAYCFTNGKNCPSSFSSQDLLNHCLFYPMRKYFFPRLHSCLFPNPIM